MNGRDEFIFSIDSYPFGVLRHSVQVCYTCVVCQSKLHEIEYREGRPSKRMIMKKRLLDRRYRDYARDDDFAQWHNPKFWRFIEQ